ncbi:MAG: lysophospholipid acyltransferase family protein [Promethearchaeota archaeon]
MEIIKKIAKPFHEAVKGIRSLLDGVGILKDIDFFFYNNIEDPIYYLWFTQAYDFKIINDDVIPTKEEGPFLLATNHQSILDPLVSGLAVVHRSKRVPWQLTKSELFENPLFGNFVAANQTIPIKRGENDLESLQRCIDEMIINNRPVMVYPEGTYGPRDGTLLPFKTGIARLAWDAQVPVISMATYGLYDILPHEHFKSFKPSGVKLRVGFGDRLTLDKLFPGKKKGDKVEHEDFKKATNKIQDAVQAVWDMLARDYS